MKKECQKFPIHIYMRYSKSIFSEGPFRSLKDVISKATFPLPKATTEARWFRYFRRFKRWEIVYKSETEAEEREKKPPTFFPWKILDVLVGFQSNSSGFQLQQRNPLVNISSPMGQKGGKQTEPNAVFANSRRTRTWNGRALSRMLKRICAGLHFISFSLEKCTHK